MATFKIKRGLEADLPQLDEGELGLATDTGKLFIGSPDGNLSFSNSSVTERALQLLKQDIINTTGSMIDETAQSLLQKAIDESFKTVNEGLNAFDKTKANTSEINALVPRIYQEIINRVDQAGKDNSLSYASKSSLNQSISKLNDNMDAFKESLTKDMANRVAKVSKDLNVKLEEINKIIKTNESKGKDYIENRLTEKANLRHKHKIDDVADLQVTLDTKISESLAIAYAIAL